jgi:hypothetical protein
VTGSIGIHLDITEQKEEKCILNFREKYKCSRDFDVEGRIEWVNASFEKCQAIPRGVNRGETGSLLQGANSDPETVTYLKIRSVRATL